MTREEEGSEGGPWEASDARPGSAAGLGLVLALLITAALLIAWRIDAAGPGRRFVPRIGRNGAFTHGPAYRTSIESAWPALEAQFQAHLDTYGWVDRKARRVRIPIERAMEIEAEQAGKPAGKGEP